MSQTVGRNIQELIKGLGTDDDAPIWYEDRKGMYLSTLQNHMFLREQGRFFSD